MVPHHDLSAGSRNILLCTRDKDAFETNTHTRSMELFRHSFAIQLHLNARKLAEVQHGSAGREEDAQQQVHCTSMIKAATPSRPVRVTVVNGAEIAELASS